MSKLTKIALLTIVSLSLVGMLGSQAKGLFFAKDCMDKCDPSRPPLFASGLWGSYCEDVGGGWYSLIGDVSFFSSGFGMLPNVAIQISSDGFYESGDYPIPYLQRWQSGDDGFDMYRVTVDPEIYETFNQVAVNIDQGVMQDRFGARIEINGGGTVALSGSVNQSYDLEYTIQAYDSPTTQSSAGSRRICFKEVDSLSTDAEKVYYAVLYEDPDGNIFLYDLDDENDLNDPDPGANEDDRPIAAILKFPSGSYTIAQAMLDSMSWFADGTFWSVAEFWESANLSFTDGLRADFRYSDIAVGEDAGNNILEELRITAVVYSTPDGSGGWTPVGRVRLDYYTYHSANGGDISCYYPNNGPAGELMSVRTQTPKSGVSSPDGADNDDWDSHEVTYFRYYTTNDLEPEAEADDPRLGRLMLVLEPAWYARLAAENSKDYVQSSSDAGSVYAEEDEIEDSGSGDTRYEYYLNNLSDSVLTADYTSFYYIYDSNGDLQTTVTKSGCGSCGDAATGRGIQRHVTVIPRDGGTELADLPQTLRGHWDEKVVTELREPTGTSTYDLHQVETVYLNAYGQTLLRVTETPDSPYDPGSWTTAPQWFRDSEFFVYSEDTMGGNELALLQAMDNEFYAQMIPITRSWEDVRFYYDGTGIRPKGPAGFQLWRAEHSAIRWDGTGGILSDVLATRRPDGTINWQAVVEGVTDNTLLDFTPGEGINGGGDYEYLRDDEGVLHLTAPCPVNIGGATEDQAGLVGGMLHYEAVRQGDQGTTEYLRSYKYIKNPDDADQERFVVAEVKEFHDAGTTASGYTLTTYSYTWYGVSEEYPELQHLIAQKTTNRPVTFGDSPDTLTSITQYDIRGNVIWTKDSIGLINHYEYDEYDRLVQQIEDVDTDDASITDEPWSTHSVYGGLHHVTDYTYDDFGRLTEVLGPQHPVEVETPGSAGSYSQILVRTARWTVRKEGNPVELNDRWTATGYKVADGEGLTGYTDGSYGMVGPITVEELCKLDRAINTYTVTSEEDLPGSSNAVFEDNGTSGKLDDSDVVNMDVDWSSADPNDYIFSRSKVSFDYDGQLVWRRTYSNITGNTLTTQDHGLTDGTLDEDYSETTYAYDDLGRPVEVARAAATRESTADDEQLTVTTHGFRTINGEVLRETRVYPLHVKNRSSATTDVYELVGLVQVTWSNEEGQLVRSWTATCDLPSSGSGRPTGSETLTEISRTAYTYDWRGRRVETRRYFDLHVLKSYDEVAEEYVHTFGYIGLDEDGDKDINYHVISTSDVDGDGEADVDGQGRALRREDAAGNITATVYDGAGRVKRVYVGTNAAGATRTDPAAGSGDMMMVTENFYDLDRDGDGTERPYLTQRSTLRSSDTLVDSDSDGVFDFEDLNDNQTFDTGEPSAYANTEYEPYEETSPFGLVGLLPFTPGNTAHYYRASEVRQPVGDARTVTYDDGLGTRYAGQLSSTQIHASSGQRLGIGGRLASSMKMVAQVRRDAYIDTRYEYDGAGRQYKVLQPAGAVTRTEYDAGGRVVWQALVADEGSTEAYTDDLVIEQTCYEYDLAGNVIKQITYRRDDDDPDIHDPTDPNYDPTLGLLSTNWSIAQISYVYTYYNEAGRVEAVENHGVIAGDPASVAPTYSSPAHPDVVGAGYTPATDKIVQWMRYYDAYDFDGDDTNYTPDGSMVEVTANDGVKTRRYTNRLGQTIFTVENVDNFYATWEQVEGEGTTGTTLDDVYDWVLNGVGDSSDSSKDRVTASVFNVAGQVVSLTAVEDAGANAPTLRTSGQETSYVYTDNSNANVSSASLVKRNGLLKYVIYPDSDEEFVDGAITRPGSPDGNNADYITFAYYASGARQTRTDQRGVELAYAYDDVGRLESQIADTSGATAVRNDITEIRYEYDGIGRLTKVQTGDDSDGFTVMTEVERTYDVWGMMSSEEQVIAVSDPTYTKTINYTYDESAAVTGRVTDDLRLESVEYPDGREVHYTYDVDDSINDVLGRVYMISDSLTDTTPADNLPDDAHTIYRYLGAGSIVGVQHPLVKRVTAEGPPETLTATGLELTYGTGNDDYSGLDQFGRVTSLVWQSMEDVYTSPDEPHVFDQFDYTYDASGNRTSRQNVVASGDSVHLDELYVYDELHRLEDVQVGQLATSPSLAISSLARQETFGLDALGNWATYLLDENGDGDALDSNDLTQSRLHNAANEIDNDDVDLNAPHADAIDEEPDPEPDPVQKAWASPAYDSAGNMTIMPQVSTPTASDAVQYDAWNRPRYVFVDSNSDGIYGTGDTLVSEFHYDGLGRRVYMKERVDSTEEEWCFYYNAAWQVVQVDKTQTYDQSSQVAMYEQYVWDVRYIDSPVFRERNTTVSTFSLAQELDDRLYYLTDANMNVTAVVNEEIPYAVVEADREWAAERYRYSAYGTPTFMTNSFVDYGTQESDTDVENRLLFAGYRYDKETSLYHVRNRYYYPGLGWITRDPAGYVDGASLYQYSVSNPVSYSDPSGLVVILVHGVHGWNDRNPSSWYPTAIEGLNRGWETERYGCRQEIIGFHWGDMNAPLDFSQLERELEGGILENATDSIHGAREHQYMVRAGERLAEVIWAARLASIEREPINIIAHSQGTIITMMALQNESADSVIFMGSPWDPDHGWHDKPWSLHRGQDRYLFSNFVGNAGRFSNYYSDQDRAAHFKGGVGHSGLTSDGAGELKRLMEREHSSVAFFNREFAKGKVYNGYRLPDIRYDHGSYVNNAEFYSNIHIADIIPTETNWFGASSLGGYITGIASNWRGR